VGAPLADDSRQRQLGVIRGGSVYRCNPQQQQQNSDSNNNACEPIPFDLSGK